MKCFKTLVNWEKYLTNKQLLNNNKTRDKKANLDLCINLKYLSKNKTKSAKIDNKNYLHFEKDGVKRCMYMFSSSL